MLQEILANDGIRDHQDGVKLDIDIVLVFFTLQ
jgi:hypothetical protein